MARRTPLALVPLFALALIAACGGGNHEDLSTPATGGSGGGSASCTANTDCSGDKPVCDPLSGVCVECLFDTQCGPSERCEGNACEAIVGCTSSLDCVKLPPNTICDPVSSTCVQCVEAADCATAADCIDNTCQPYQACTTSLDCTPGMVCDPAKGRCVACVTEADCGPGMMCIASECVVRTSCVSDNQCTPLGKLCDKTLGYCVDCLDHGQCPDAYHCALGLCVLDACQAGAMSCQGNAQVTCLASGEGWTAPQPCPDKSACKPNQGCVPWVCTPGTTCVGEMLTTCSADGMTVLETVNCASGGLHCVGDACLDMVCSPSALFCEGNQVRRCNADGSASSLVQTCGANQFCDPASTSCVTQVCTPGAPVCNGSIATTCNASGTGYVAGGTDCAAQNKGCSGGACVGCPSGGVTPSAVRLAEVFIGTNDYVVLVNRGGCPAQLDTLSLRIGATDPQNILEFDLPAQLLAAGARVYVIDVNGAKTGDIPVGQNDNIFLTPDTGEYVALCQGPCSSGVVLDYFAHASGAQPPLPPVGITFTPAPLTGITMSTQDTQAYVRSAYAGASPSFKASDWQVGAASRPYENVSTCPPTQPAGGSACSMGTGEFCVYGAVTCICFMSWMCQ